MRIPQHLIYIVLVQFAFFVATKAISRRFGLTTQSNVFLSVAVAVAFGILMDVVLGAYGIFGYTLDGRPETSIEPRQLPLAVLLFNAIASYGLTVATVATVAGMFSLPVAPSRLWKRITAVVLSLGLFGVATSHRASITMMFSWGIVIISGGELLLASGKQTGPFLALFAHVNFAPVLRMWAFSFVVGLFYETANWLFTFWIWLPGSNYATSIIRVLITVAGYVAIIHPIC
ncbi:MAG: hypothetical protein H0T87_07890, partial [Gammaproteobacteria bacterium]|nr:hypothetical protein [Gammaproteobacteria bacterium]